MTPIALGVPVNSNNDVVTFTYTAATGGMSSGTLTLTVPSGWSAPVTTNAVGCTTASMGTLSASGQTITVAGVTLAAGATTVITYGAVSGGSCNANDGATAPASAGALTFTVREALDRERDAHGDRSLAGRDSQLGHGATAAQGCARVLRVLRLAEPERT